MTSHLSILIFAALIFVAMQIYLVMKVRKWMRDFSRTLELASKTNSAEKMPDWFAPFFATSQNQTHITAAREIALRQLEEHAFSRPSFLSLQKLSIAAPLVGVVFTAIGFMTIEGGFEEISELAMPLVSGVATGAILALINQGILQWCEIRLEESRLAGQKLIDKVWVSKVGGFDPVRQLSLVAMRFNSTTESLAQLVGDFPDDVSELTTRFDNIAELTKSTFKEMRKISPELRNAILTWTEASRRLSDATDNGLVESLERLKLSTNSLANASEKIVELTDSIEITAETLTKSAKRNDDLANSMQSTVNKTIESMRTSNSREITELKNAVEELAKPLRSTASDLASLSEELGASKQLVAHLASITTGFGTIVESQFKPATKTLDKYTESAATLSDSAEKMADYLEKIESVTKKQTDVSEALANLIQLRALPTADVLLRATGTFEDASHSIAESGHELSAVLTELRSQVEDMQAERMERKDEGMFETKVED